MKLSTFLPILVIVVLATSCGGSISIPPSPSGCETCPKRCLTSKDGQRGRCVACIVDSDCQETSSPTKKCNQDNQCTCGTDKDCPEGKRCDGANGCVDCRVDKDCKDPNQPLCINQRCRECGPDDEAECHSSLNPGETLCGKGTKRCESYRWGSCKGSVICKAGETCEKGSCQTIETCKDACSKGEARCNGTKISTCETNKETGCLDWSTPHACTQKEWRCISSLKQCALCEPGTKRNCFDGKTDQANQGICREGSQVCDVQGAQYGPCVGQVLPKKEECNGTDDDCDGKTDLEDGCECIDGNTQPCYPKAKGCSQLGQSYQCKGKCKAGLRTCISGKWGTCQGMTVPSTENCSGGVDDDCDGTVDNGPGCVCKIGETKPCGKDTGECQKGVATCLDGKSYSSCKGDRGPTAEQCNGKDDDCNGVIDDNLKGLGQACTDPSKKGLCSQGTTVCQSGALLCKTPTPQTETCDGKDNNCNGAIDDIPSLNQACQLAQQKGECRIGQWRCINNTKTCKQTIQPTAEQCDGKDNNCNGTIDDIPNLNKTCAVPQSKGVCSVGQWRCSGNQVTCQQTVQPSNELCNGKDDNCDGMLDNVVGLGQNCTLSNRKGECRTGAWACINNAKQCKQTTQSTPEQCDGKDNDCNGTIDDNIAQVGQACSISGKQGQCSRGTYVCNQTLQCQQTNQPQTEFCDQTDNDCDGNLNNGVCKTQIASTFVSGTYMDQGQAITADQRGIYVTGYLSIKNPTGQTTYWLAMFVSKLNYNGVEQWRKTLTTQSEGNGIAVDSVGNIYVTGMFEGRAIVGSTTLQSAGGRDAFVIKLDNNGKYLWAKSAGGNGRYSDIAYGVTVDSIRQRVYIAGSFNGTARFGTHTLSAKGRFDAFVTQMDTNGTFLWAKGMGGTSGEASSRALTVDPSGNLYATGYFNKAISIGGTSFTAPNNSNTYVSKLTSAGQFLWTKVLGSQTNAVQGKAIVNDSKGNVYLGGHFSQTWTLSGTTLATRGSTDALIIKMDPTGKVLWANSAGGSSVEYLEGLAVDSSNHVYAIGIQHSKTMFYGNITPLPTQAVTQTPSVFLMTLSATSGAFLSARTVGTTNYAFGYGITTHGGHTYATGSATRANQFQSINILKTFADFTDARSHAFFWKAN